MNVFRNKYVKFVRMPIKQNIDDVLKSLDGANRAEPNPFFTGRVMQRLQSTEPNQVQKYWPRMVWAFSAVAVLIVLNLILFFSQMRSVDRTISDWKSTTPQWVVDYTQNPGSTYYDIPHK